jgi:hypothetical protein
MPKRTTTPLAKSYTTLEGWIVIAANVALVATPIVTTALSATQAAKYGALINSIYILSRALVKAAGARQQPSPALAAAPVVTPDALTLDEAAAPLVRGSLSNG